MELPIADAAASVVAKTAADAKITHTGRIETVAGYAREHVTVESVAQTVDICRVAVGRPITQNARLRRQRLELRA